MSKKLTAKAARAAAYPAVRAAYLAGEFRYPAANGKTVLKKGQRLITKEERKILLTRGNPAIKMKDLCRLTRADYELVMAKAPQHGRWCRCFDYSRNEWWSDCSRPVEAKRASIYESWNSARTLALMSDRADEEEEEEAEAHWAEAWSSFLGEEGEAPDEESSVTDEVIVRDGAEMQDLLEEVLLDRPNVLQGEDYWTDTEYPVLESQASFMPRGSNDDLDDIFGEEPRDERGCMAAHIERTRGWRASSQEEAFAESSCHKYHPCARSLPSGIEPVDEHMGKETPPPKYSEEGKLVSGFFMGRSEYFAQKEENMRMFDSQYQWKKPKGARPAPVDFEAIRKERRKR